MSRVQTIEERISIPTSKHNEIKRRIGGNTPHFFDTMAVDERVFFVVHKAEMCCITKKKLGTTLDPLLMCIR